MTVDHASLVSGAFALLRLMDHLSAVPGMQQAKRLLMHVLSPHWALSLKVDDTAVNNTDDSLERQETKRLAIAFIYLKVATKGPALESQELLDAITSLVIMEPALDYLHGSSWIQLTWLYITASNNLGSPDPEPLVQHRIMEGLNATLGSADSIAHTVLGHHIESIQLWFWRMTTEQHSSKISDLLLPNLLLDWITRRAPNKALGETQHFGNQELNAISMHIISYPKALSALKTLFTNYLATVIDPDSTKKENAQMVFDLVCSTIECCCRSLQDLAPDLNPAPVEKGSLAESQHRFFGRVLSDSLDVLTKEAFSTEEVPQLLLNVVEVLLQQIESHSEKPSALPAWDIEPLSSSRATHQLHRGIHLLRAKAMDLTDVSKKLYNIVRLLVVISKLEVMKNSTQTIFEVEPLMASTLWECIQEIMDRFTTMQHDPDPGALDSHELPYGFGLKFLVAGMQLILVGYMRSSTAMTWFGLDDLALMSYYAIELCKRTRSREVPQSAEYAMSARLLLSVLGQVAHKVKDYAGNRSDDGTDRELWDQNESRVVWKTLGALQVIMNDLFTLVSQALTANNAVRPTRSREVPLDLFLWVRSKLIHPDNRVFLGGLVHRWIEEAMLLKKVEEEKTLLHPLLLRSGWRQLDQAGLDILSMARMIFLMTSSDPRSMPSDSSVSVVFQWLQEFLQDPVVSTFHNLRQQSQGRNYS
ncbi:MAG: hypothetical protein BYD32DRAFT_455878 [Podila humilis]|nr:MAG: hypothetical protein BYD32DRAFT_455878 [Podila humilis]